MKIAELDGHKRQLEQHIENLTGISAPVRLLPCESLIKCILLSYNIKTN